MIEVIKEFWVKVENDWHGSFESGAESIEYCQQHEYELSIWTTLGTGSSPKAQKPTPWLIVSKQAEAYLLLETEPEVIVDFSGRVIRGGPEYKTWNKE